MKNNKLVLLATGFALFGVVSAVIYLQFFRSPSAKAGLRVLSNVPTMVFVNNTQIGTTPIDKMFVAGDAVIKLIPESTSSAYLTYQTTIHLTDNTYSIIQRNFAATEAETSGSTIYLSLQNSTTSSLSVTTSDPDSASVVMDSEPQGFSPLTISSVTPSDHRLEITAPGYQPQTILAKTVAGYKLTINAKLAALPASQQLPITNFFITPTPSVTATASASLKVKITDTPTGFLRVRLSPNLNASEAARIKPGEIFTVLDSKTGWYQISGDFTSTDSGWISSQYANKL